MDEYKLNFTVLELEILSFLSIGADKKYSQREIALALDVSPTAIANSLKNLVVRNLVKIEVSRTSNLVSYNRDDPEALMLKRLENQKMLYYSEILEFLEEKLAGSTLVLFGSYAKGEDTSKSDIDLAVIGRKEKSLDLEKYEKILNKKININYYASWKDINNELKNNILNGIVLFGSVEI